VKKPEAAHARLLHDTSDPASGPARSVPASPGEDRGVAPATLATAGDRPSAAAIETGAVPDGLVDWATLDVRYPQPGFMEKVAHTTLTSHGTTPARLREKARCGDLAALRFLTHTVKGVGGNLEARRLHDMARLAEAAARDAQDDAIVLAERLADEMDAFLAEIARRYPAIAHAVEAGAATVGAA
jgi:hypothetical protein